MASNLLVDRVPAPSSREPASVGLNRSAQKGSSDIASKLQADCN
jgi:hypothetical protein